jgi:hypothetical protein
MEGIAGPWIDRRTGKTVIVRDAIQDGDQMIIISSAGQIPTDVFQNYFVQISEEEYSAASLGISKEVSGSELVQQVNRGLDGDLQIKQANTNQITLDTPIGGPSIQTTEKPQVTQPPVIETKTVIETKQEKVVSESQNINLIKKVFDKHTNEPTINFNINIDEWPVAQLKMLISVFDVSFDEIADYVINEYLTPEILKEYFSEYLKTELYK